MKFGTRPLGTVLGALFKRQHYVAGLNMLSVYESPFEMFSRYLLGWGAYPSVVRVNTPMGRLPLTVYSSDDVLSVNEIFCRNDYPADSTDKLFVDFGANIGLSAAYFLSRHADSFAYLYEPLPQNIARLRENLRFAEGRYELHEVAVGPTIGRVQFGWEQTGRYGGIGRTTGQYIDVECADSNVVLRDIVTKRNHIDVLKVDIETLEREVVERISPELRDHIRKMYVEFNFGYNPLHATHHMRQYGSVAQFTLLQHSGRPA